MTLTLPIVVGKRYVRRDGAVVTVQSSINGTATIGECAAVFCTTGRANLDDGPATSQDLVADYVEATAHPHAASMALYAQDAAETSEPWLRWEYTDAEHPWRTMGGHPGWILDTKYRRKPRTIRIGEFDVPEPWCQPLEKGAHYWLVGINDGEAGAIECTNFTPSTGLKHVKAGLVHLTREAAEQHARALLSFTEQK